MAAIGAELGTIEDANAPDLIRGALLALLGAAEADEAFFYRAAEGSAGPVVARSDHLGSERVAGTFRRFSDAIPVGLLRGTRWSSPWDPAQLRPHETKTFVETTALFDMAEVERSEFFQTLWREAGVADQQRLVVSDHDRIAGCVGLFRTTGAPLFTRAEGKRLAPLVAPLTARLTAASRMDELGPGIPGDLVVRPDGSVEFASEDGRQWLTSHTFADALRRGVRALDGARDDDVLRILEGAAETRFLRLDGREGVRYLATLRPLTPYAPSVPHRLSLAEREIAELAAAGATAKEIAAHRGTREGTVRNQLKRIYSALGVSNRLELGRALRG